MEAFKQTPYEATLENILLNGYNHEDRTGVGRRSIFGVLNRYDLSGDKMPIVNTRKVYHRGSILEMLELFIKGVGITTKLKEKGVNFWGKWEVKEADINAFVLEVLETEKGRSVVPEGMTVEQIKEKEEEFVNFLTARLMKTTMDGIGPMYGVNWRNAPADPNVTPFHPIVPIEEMPSDKVEKWEAAWQQILESRLEGQEIPEDAKLRYFNDRYYSTVDQLNELLRNLRHRPHSSRLVVTAWVPQSVPFEEMAPERNVLIGKGALAACHTMFQVFVKPAEQEGGKKRLSLMMTQRSADFPVGVPHNITQYAFLAHALAHVMDMEADEFIHSIGDAHIYFNQVEKVKEQITRSAFDFATIKINPDVKDLFKLTIDDVTIEGYQSHEPIEYEVAK